MVDIGELYDEFEACVDNSMHYKFKTEGTIKGEPIPRIGLDEPYPFLKIALLRRAYHNL